MKLMTIEQMRRKSIKIIKEILTHYNNIDVNIEIQRNRITNEEIGKTIIIRLNKEY